MGALDSLRYVLLRYRWHCGLCLVEESGTTFDIREYHPQQGSECCQRYKQSAEPQYIKRDHPCNGEPELQSRGLRQRLPALQRHVGWKYCRLLLKPHSLGLNL